VGISLKKDVCLNTATGATTETGNTILTLYKESNKEYPVAPVAPVAPSPFPPCPPASGERQFAEIVWKTLFYLPFSPLTFGSVCPKHRF
jgi:hypothetical protein